MTDVRREKPYTCMDVDLPRNGRLLDCKDPAGCLGLWNALVAYAREQLTDGLVPKSYAIALWGDRKNNARLVDMVRTGLLADRGNEVEVLRYSPRNQTRAAVEEAKRQARERMAARRASAKRPGSVGVLPNNTRTFAEHPPDVPTSTSTSISKDQKQERDPEEIAVGGSGGSAFAHFEEQWWLAGVLAATGAPQSPLRPWDRIALEEACRTAFGHLRGGAGESAIRGSAEAWGRSLRVGQGVHVSGYVGWLRGNNYRPATETVAARSSPPETACDLTAEERAEQKVVAEQMAAELPALLASMNENAKPMVLRTVDAADAVGADVAWTPKARGA